MSRYGTRRSSILKRRTSGAERIILFIKRFGIVIVAAATIAGLSYWFVTSGAKDALALRVEKTYLATTSGWGFVVENIMVEGRGETDVDTLKAMIAVDKGDPLFGVSPHEVQTRLEKLPWIKKASVERRLPDTLYVGVEERVPLALWQRNKKLVLIDRDGVVLTDQHLERWRDFIIVTGDDAPAHTAELIEMLKAEPDILTRTDSATLIGGRRWDLTLKSGAVVKLPERDLGVALRRLAMNQEEDGILDRDVLTIDVREEGRITVRAKPGAAQDLKNGHSSKASGKAV